MWADCNPTLRLGTAVPILSDLERALTDPPRALQATAGRAAVAAIFNDHLEVLLMRRAEHPSDPWSGHLSFPGGRMEPDDPDPAATAIRETHEEVGLRLQRDQLVGRLDDLAAVGGRPGLVIRPFVFALPGAVPPLAPSPDEVQSLHWLSLDRLIAGDGRSTMTWSHRGQTRTLPCVDFDGVRLWGLTLHMLDGLVARLDR